MGAQDNRDFASLLDELLAEQPEEFGHGAGRTLNFDHLAVADELLSGRIVISPDRAAAEYREAGAPEPGETDGAPPLAPDLVYPETDTDSVARELGLADATMPADLDALRRRFALANHPDRVDPRLREHAMTRMQIANMLIDAAKRARSTSR